MVLRSRPLMQENGSGHELDPCVTQYCEIPYACSSLEQRRDLATISRGGARFPTKLCLLTVFVSFVIAVILMPLLALTKLPSDRSDIAWWKRGVIYHINVASFYDSDGDGVGDIQGIIQKLDYIQSLGVVGVELAPFFPGNMDGTVGISNHTTVDPVLGSLSDIEDLTAKLHNRGLKILIPFLPNQLSDGHTQIEASLSHSEPYTDFYIRNKDKEGTMPNHWVVLVFWLRLGVDGVRIHGVENLVESEDPALDEPSLNTQELDHKLTSHQQESLEVLSKFGKILAEFSKKYGKKIPLIPCVNSQFSHPEFWMSTYDHGGDMPQNTALTRLTTTTLSGHTLHTAIKHVMDRIPFNKGEHWITWNSDDLGVSRVWSGLGGGQYAEVGLAVTLLLPGTGIVYYGQEIGMTNLHQPDNREVRKCSLGQAVYDNTTCSSGRGLMQWSEARHGGFSMAEKTWLPTHPSYTTLNTQIGGGDPSSLLHAFRSMLSLRRDPAFMLGQHDPMVVNDNIYSFCRINRGRFFPKYFVTMNVGKESSTDNYQDTNVTLKVPEDFIVVKVKIPSNGTIAYHSANFADTNRVGQIIDIRNLTLAPGQVLVVKL